MRRMTLMMIVMLLVLSACGIASELIPFKDTTTTWDNIKTIAAQEKKLIFIDAYTDWCIWCKVMDKETFSDPAVANFMNEKFVPVHYEMETGFGMISSHASSQLASPQTNVMTASGNRNFTQRGQPSISPSCIFTSR